MTVSAHGKIIWVGEHACINDCPAIVSDIPFIVKVHDGFEDFSQNTWVSNFLNVEKLSVHISGNLPRGVGLGFSSAFLAALYTFYVGKYSLKFDVEEQVQCIMGFEDFTSGVDAFGVTHEGCFMWTRSYTEELNRIFFPYFLINTGSEDTTFDMLTHVNLVPGFEECVELFKIGLTYDDLNMIEASVFRCEELLEKSGAVDAKAKKLIDWLGFKGFAAKITGAGGKTNGSGVVIGIGRLNDSLRCTIREDYGFDILYES